jgi:VanZ like family
VSQVWLVYGDVLVAFVLVLPAAVAVACALAWLRRRRGMSTALAFRWSLADVGGVVGTAPWLWMTMRPDPARNSRVDLVPIRDLLSLEPRAVLVQVVGNLLVLAAFGFFLPLRFPAFASWRRLLVAAAATSAVIELGQFALDLGRVSSLDDVLVNTVGAGLGALLSRRWWRPHGVSSEGRSMDVRRD